jgi:hypothetical protein
MEDIPSGKELQQVLVQSSAITKRWPYFFLCKLIIIVQIVCKLFYFGCLFYLIGF